MFKFIEIKNNIEKNFNNEKIIRHYLPVVKEWNNSIYKYNKNIKTLFLKDKSVYKLISCYFNLKKIKTLRKKRKFSIIKVFISKQDIKHTNNKVLISLCVYNKEKISLKKYIFNLYKKAYIKAYKKVLLTNNKYLNIYISKFLSKITKVINIQKKSSYILLKYRKHYILNIIYILREYENLFNLKEILVKLKFINYKYNINNFLGLKIILNKIYNKKIEFNIINLKYLYLDSNILTEAVAAKLKDRKAKLLKNIIKSIYRVKIPYIKIIDNVKKVNNINFNKIVLIKNPDSIIKNDINIIKNSIYVYIEKLSIVLYKLKFKTIRGIRIQGSGRLTRRLTALRSVSKLRQKGSLKNIYSSYHKVSTIMLTGYIKSNIQYIKKNYNNRNGSYGIRTDISSI